MSIAIVVRMFNDISRKYLNLIVRIIQLEIDNSTKKVREIEFFETMSST